MISMLADGPNNSFGMLTNRAHGIRPCPTWMCVGLLRCTDRESQRLPRGSVGQARRGIGRDPH